MSSIGEIAKFRTSIETDTINEFTSASGVRVDGVLLKDANITASGTGTNLLSGNTGIGVGAFSDTKLRIGGSPGTAATLYGIYVDNAFASTATGTCTIISTIPSLVAASFTMGTIYHFRAYGASIGSGAALTNQYGFFADATISAASGTNYGFYSNIAASGATRYNFYAGGTAPNFMAGLLSVGNTATTDVALSTTVAAKLRSGSAAYTDNVTAASGTVAHGTVVSFDNPAIAATNTSVTYTTASTLYIDGAPTAGSNVTIGTAWSLFVAGGNSYFSGNLRTASILITDLSTVTCSATGTATITVTKSFHSVAGFGGAASTVTTISGGFTGGHLVLRADSDTVDITFATGGNLALAGGASFTLDSNLDTICFIYDGNLSKWLELYRSSNS